MLHPAWVAGGVVRCAGGAVVRRAGGGVVRCARGAVVWRAGGGVVCRGAGLALVVTGTPAGLVDGGVDEGVLDGVLGDGDMESEAAGDAVVMTALVDGAACPASWAAPADPQAPSASAAKPVRTATTVRLRFMPRTVGSARHGSRPEPPNYVACAGPDRRTSRIRRISQGSGYGNSSTGHRPEAAAPLGPDPRSGVIYRTLAENPGVHPAALNLWAAGGRGSVRGGRACRPGRRRWLEVGQPHNPCPDSESRPEYQTAAAFTTTRAVIIHVGWAPWQ